MIGEEETERVTSDGTELKKKTEEMLTKAKGKDIIILEDIPILHSLGAKATVSPEEEITVPGSNEPAFFVAGELIRNVEAFAGKGTKTKIKERFDLEEFYEGTLADEWVKVKGKAHVIHQGEYLYAEVHWYHEDSIGGVEYKAKRQKGGEIWLDEKS